MSDYHRMPGLSSSGARKLLPPSCPAKFKWELDNPPAPRDTFDFGHAAHRFVLGKGEEIARIDFPDRRTKASKEAIADARAKGMVPLLAKDYAVAVEMAKKLREHEKAAALFSDGEPEHIIRWQDRGNAAGVQLRAMLDWRPDGGVVFPDYKTADSAEPGKFARAVFSHGYHIQQAFYLDGIKHALGIEDARFKFVVQEKTPPYLVTVVELDEVALEIGRQQMREAIDVYARCLQTNTWPGYADDTVMVTAPSWAVNRYMDSFAPDDIVVG